MGIAGGVALVAAGLVLIPVGGAALAVAGAATIGPTMATVAGAAAAVGGTSVIAVSLSPKKLMLEKYSDMLKLAIHEASLWNNSASNPDDKLPLTELEVLLQQEGGPGTYLNAACFLKLTINSIFLFSMFGLTLKCQLRSSDKK